MIKKSWRYARVLRRGEGGSSSMVQRVAISRESRGRKWGKVKFSSRDQRRRERFWLWSRVRTPFEPRGRPSQKEGGGRGKKGLRNKKRLRSSKLRGRAPGRRHGRLRERAMRFWCNTVWMHRTGPAEKTSACWRHYYPPWSKQAAENRSGKIAYFPTLVSYYVTGIFPWSNVKIQTLLLTDYPAFPINSIFGNSPKNSTGWRWRKKKRERESKRERKLTEGWIIKEITGESLIRMEDFTRLYFEQETSSNSLLYVTKRLSIIIIRMPDIADGITHIAYISSKRRYRCPRAQCAQTWRREGSNDVVSRYW